MDIILLNECSQYTWLAESVGLKTIKLINQRNTRWCHTGKSMTTLNMFFLHCYTASILMHLNNCWSFECRMAKISLIQSVMRRTTAVLIQDWFFTRKNIMFPLPPILNCFYSLLAIKSRHDDQIPCTWDKTRIEIIKSRRVAEIWVPASFFHLFHFFFPIFF